MSETKSDRHFTTSELLFAFPAGALLGAIVGALIGDVMIENDILKAQVHELETGDNTLLMNIKADARERFFDYTALGGALGLFGGLGFLQGINVARNASSEHQCSHRCSHHKPV